MAAGEIHHLCNLGFRHLERKHTHHGDTFLVNGQHHFECLRMSHAEEPLQHMHDELHRGVIVIEQQDLVKRRTLSFGARFGDDAGLVVWLALSAGHKVGRKGQSGPLGNFLVCWI